MLVNIADIPAEGLSFDLELDQKDISTLAEVWGPGVKGRVLARLELRLVVGALEISGNVSAKLILQCSRCLKDYPYGVGEDFSNTYIVRAAGNDERELTLDDLSESHITDSEIDLNEVIVEELLLQTPTKPLCNSACKGLCARCGADLNVESCECEISPDIDPRLARLKDFRVKSD